MHGFHTFAADVRRVLQVLAKLVIGVFQDLGVFHSELLLNHPERRGLIGFEHLHALGIGAHDAPNDIFVGLDIGPAGADGDRDKLRTFFGDDSSAR